MRLILEGDRLGANADIHPTDLLLLVFNDRSYQVEHDSWISLSNPGTFRRIFD